MIIMIIIIDDDYVEMVEGLMTKRSSEMSRNCSRLSVFSCAFKLSPVGKKWLGLPFANRAEQYQRL